MAADSSGFEANRSRPAGLGRLPVTAPDAVYGTIRSANVGYLRALATSCVAPQGLAAELPPAFRARIGSLDAVACTQVAAVPFTLYSLKFGDADYWRAAIHGRLERNVDDPCRVSLARTAVFLAWHLVRSGSCAAGVALGMSAEVADLYRSVPLSQLDGLSECCPAVLVPRWPTRDDFWTNLAAGAVCQDALERARFHGLRLLAAESLAAVPTIKSPRRVRSA